MKRTFEEYEAEKKKLKNTHNVLLKRQKELSQQIYKVEDEITNLDKIQKSELRAEITNGEFKNPNLYNIPAEIIDMITDHLDYDDIFNLRKVNSVMRERYDFKNFLYKYVKADDKIVVQKLPIDGKAIVGLSNYVRSNEYENKKCFLREKDEKRNYDWPRFYNCVKSLIGQKTINFITKTLKIKYDFYEKVRVTLWDDGMFFAHYKTVDFKWSMTILNAYFKVGILPECERVNLTRTAGKTILGPWRGKNSQGSPLKCYIFDEKELTGKLYKFPCPFPAAKIQDQWLGENNDFYFMSKCDIFRVDLSDSTMTEQQEVFKSHARLTCNEYI